MKKLIRIISVFLIFCSIVPSAPVFASEDTAIVQPCDNGYYTWKVSSTEVLGVVYLSSSPKYWYSRSGAAAKDGEVYTASVELSLAVTVEGNVQVSYGALSAAAGYNVTGSVSVSGAQTTAALAKGEYVNTYITPQYRKIKITQVHGYQLHADFYTDGNTAVAYVYIPVTPQITFTYHQT